MEAPGQTQARDEPHSFPGAFTHPVLHSYCRSPSVCSTLTQALLSDTWAPTSCPLRGPDPACSPGMTGPLHLLQPPALMCSSCCQFLVSALSVAASQLGQMSRDVVTLLGPSGTVAPVLHLGLQGLRTGVFSPSGPFSPFWISPILGSPPPSACRSARLSALP